MLILFHVVAHHSVDCMCEKKILFPRFTYLQLNKVLVGIAWIFVFSKATFILYQISRTYVCYSSGCQLQRPFNLMSYNRILLFPGVFPLSTWNLFKFRACLTFRLIGDWQIFIINLSMPFPFKSSCRHQYLVGSVDTVLALNSKFKIHCIKSTFLVNKFQKLFESKLHDFSEIQCHGPNPKGWDRHLLSIYLAKPISSFS